ncbi:MAG TPA: hypothetical protein PLX77_07610, partial [Candidatus Cloacimonadota bacterium]|nr:hypothetical protein [Candidatus Cloacimonadota bacterium]
GPCINILIKLMSMVSIVFGGFIVSYSPRIEALYTPKAPAIEHKAELVIPASPADSLVVNDIIVD